MEACNFCSGVWLSSIYVHACLITFITSKQLTSAVVYSTNHFSSPSDEPHYSLNKFTWSLNLVYFMTFSIVLLPATTLIFFLSSRVSLELVCVVIVRRSDFTVS